MLLLIAILLAIFVVPTPWSVLLVLVAAVFEIGEMYFWWWFSRRRKPTVGAETLVGRSGIVVSPCRPRGQVRVFGEIWEATCSEGLGTGDAVVVRSVDVDGLTLVVDRAPA